MMFYLLSLITGILECGWIASGAVNSFPLWKILCFPLSYHIGNLFPKPFSLNRKYLYIMSALSFVTGSITSIKQLPENLSFILTCISLFLLSAVIQSVRSDMKNDGNRLLKRIFRVGGFALAPIASVIPSLILVLTSLISLYCLKYYKGENSFTHMQFQNGYSAVMIFHQLHYFFYAHITLATICLISIHKFSSMGTLISALLFCGTWITYMSVEPIVSRLTGKLLPVFYTGHTGISLLLFSMSFVTNFPLFISLWLITGFGGGVVYTISANAKNDGYYNKNSMTIAENTGHTLGLLTAMIIAVIFPDNSPQIMLVFGSVSAFLAVISMLLTRKDKYYENIHSQS